ncbi:MAG: XRE family transcriptional regulator [Prevotellaceae bacterium]|jgi:transcriptional regulator with XRE-family HTH domain|nr:XRE family transcriptional regulator [Prevotellaceae bacterium]
MSESIKVGEKIQSLREQKNITREELSERSGLSLEQVAAIEENATLPSLAPLIKIARVLGVRLGTFLDDNDELGPVVSRKADKTGGISFSNSGTESRKSMEYYSLAKSKAGRHIEPFVIQVQPCAEKDFILSSHEGEEFIYVLGGKIEINYGKEIYLLEEGDSIFYDSIVEHHVHADCKEGAKILAVVYTPF